LSPAPGAAKAALLMVTTAAAAQSKLKICFMIFFSFLIALHCKWGLQTALEIVNITCPFLFSFPQSISCYAGFVNKW
jgi:hypothetical protein